ncbi:hypothetical protein QJQ45_005428, partial [Haematococcus lacustris]
DEDVALALAIAESVKGITESQSEVAELEQALALSLSLEAEQQRLESSSSKGAAAPGSGANAKTQELLHRPFPEPKPLELAHEPLLAAAANLEQVKAPALAPLPPLKVGPNTGAERLAAISTAAALAASGLSTPPSIRNRAAGYKSGAAGSAGDVAAIREAAKQASNTQKALMAKMAGSGGQDAEQAQAWLQDAKVKLIAQKNVEREAEMEEYKKQQRKVAARGPAAAADETEAKRAALRDKLASKFKQDLLAQTSA